MGISADGFRKLLANQQQARVRRVLRRLDQPAPTAKPGGRTNARNTGKSFEGLLETVCVHYAAKGIMRLKKVEPPTRIIGGGHFKRIIFLPNPFLDFVGTWTERAGRAVFIEAKSTSEPKLPLGSDGGVTAKQVDALRDWHGAGAAVGVLWEVKGDVFFVGVRKLLAVLEVEGRKHLKPHDCEPVEQGIGCIYFDFRASLASLYPEAEKNSQETSCTKPKGV